MKSATFSRALNVLRKNTPIRINGNRIEIDSVAELAKFVYGSLTANTCPIKCNISKYAGCRQRMITARFWVCVSCLLAVAARSLVARNRRQPIGKRSLSVA